MIRHGECQGCFRLAFIGAKYSIIHDFDAN